jgi:hypothetical protein
MPEIYNALLDRHHCQRRDPADDHGGRAAHRRQHGAGDRPSPTDGSSVGTPCPDTGALISVPVGDITKGHV